MPAEFHTDDEAIDAFYKRFSTTMHVDSMMDNFRESLTKSFMENLQWNIVMFLFTQYAADCEPRVVVKGKRRKDFTKAFFEIWQKSIMKRVGQRHMESVNASLSSLKMKFVAIAAQNKVPATEDYQLAMVKAVRDVEGNYFSMIKDGSVDVDYDEDGPANAYE